MTWATIDDSMPDHPKIATLSSDEARWGLVRSICYCSRYLTDGSVPRSIAESWISQAAVAALVDAGLWIPTGDTYTVHDYLDWNKSRGEVELDRQRARERMANVRANVRRTSPKSSSTAGRGGESSRAVLKKQERERDPLWDALVAWYGSNPSGDERGAWNAACKALRLADPPVEPDELTKLLDTADSQWARSFKPTAISANLASLRRSLRNGHKPSRQAKAIERLRRQT